MSVVDDGTKVGLWLVFRKVPSGEPVGFTLSDCDGMLYLRKIGKFEICTECLAKNEQNHWWYYRANTKDWLPIYLRGSEESPECYFLTIIKEGSIGLFRGIIDNDVVIPCGNLGQEREQWLISVFGKEFDDASIVISNPTSLCQDGGKVVFFDKEPSESQPVELLYHNTKMTKKASGN